MQPFNNIVNLGIIFGLIILSVTIKTSEGANIVFLQHLGTPSHLVATMNFAEALLSKGHNLSYISLMPSPSKNPKIPYIIPHRAREYMEFVCDKDYDVSTRFNGEMLNAVQISEDLNIKQCELLLSSEELHSWLNTSPKVDLIYVDGDPECALGLAYKLQSKLAIFHTYTFLPKFFENFGIPSESSAVPCFDLTFKPPLSFIERVITTLIPIGWRWNQVRSYSLMEDYFKTYLQLEYLPPMDDLIKNISLILTNAHFLDEYQRSIPPFVVNVPGMHVKETHDPVPQEIESFINSPSSSGQPSQGFLYISLGTVAKAPKLPQWVRQVFYDSIKAFPEIRFLWRWDGEFPTDIPENLKLYKWFNQQDLLGHPMIKGFVTQAGRPSSQEAIYNAVPTITCPILADQDSNANVLERLGANVNLEIIEITQEKLTNAFHSILYDPKFQTRAKEVSQLYKDLPMKPLDTAVWWTEYILRHKDTSHLKPLAIDQTWYERRLLDVWAFIAVCSIASLYIFCTVSFFILKLIARFVLSFALKENKIKRN